MTTKAAKPTDYKHIAAWGKKLRSFAYYIADQQNRAFEAGAPIDVIYEKYGPSGPTGQWVTVGECHHEVRDEVNAMVAAM